MIRERLEKVGLTIEGTAMLGFVALTDLGVSALIYESLDEKNFLLLGCCITMKGIESQLARYQIALENVLSFYRKDLQRLEQERPTYE